VLNFAPFFILPVGVNILFSIIFFISTLSTRSIPLESKASITVFIKNLPPYFSACSSDKFCSSIILLPSFNIISFISIALSRSSIILLPNFIWFFVSY
jgi:hypothetical protein